MMDSVQHPPSKENSPFHKNTVQACSTPCTQLFKRDLSWAANVSSVLEESNECSSAEGFSKSGQDTIIVPDNDPETTLLTQQVDYVKCSEGADTLTPGNEVLPDKVSNCKIEMNNNELNQGKSSDNLITDKPVGLLPFIPLIDSSKEFNLRIVKLEKPKLTDEVGVSPTDVNSNDTKELQTDSSAECNNQIIIPDDVNREFVSEHIPRQFLSTAKADVKIANTSAFNKTIMDSCKQLNKSEDNSPIKIKFRVQPIIMSIDACDLNSSSDKIQVKPVSVIVESDKLNESENCIQVESFCLSIHGDDDIDEDVSTTLTDKNTLIQKERKESVQQEFDQNSSKVRINISIVASIDNLKGGTKNTLPNTLKLVKDTIAEKQEAITSKILSQPPGSVNSSKKQKTVMTRQPVNTFWKDKDVQLNTIDKGEINVTVTEEDIHFSKMDELSMCFDNIRAESFVTIDQVEPEETSNIIGLKRHQEDIKPSKSDEIFKKSAKEIVVPSTKKPRLDKELEIVDRPLKVYISSNAKENIDNNDPKWNKYKKLTTDELRYKGVKEVWKNPQVPNVNSNLSTYNWRCRNGLLPACLIKNNINTYNIRMEGDMKDVFFKARENAKFLFEQKVKTLKATRESHLIEYDNQLHYDLMNNERVWWQYFYDRHHDGANTVWTNYRNQYKALLDGLEERLRLLNKAEGEVFTVSNFYKGLGNSNEQSRTRMTPRELCCWYEREDTLSKYEVLYS